MATSDAVEFTLEIEPILCPRPRIALRGRFPSAYYPKAYETWKGKAEGLVAAALDALGALPALDMPLYLEARFFVEKARTSKLLWPRGDIDNYLKSFMDAATKGGLWVDDDQVVTLLAYKRFVPHKTPGSIHIYVRPDTL